MQAPQLRTLVDQFVADLQVVIRQEALEAVRGVLGDAEAPARRGPGRPRKVSTRGPGRPKKKVSKRGPGRRPRKTGRSSAEDVSGLADQVLAHVRANPGQRLEEIARDLGMSTNDLKQPVAKLLEASAVRREGKARGTKYYAGGKRKAGKRTTKKKTGRKATKKKVTRKKVPAKRAAKKTRRKLSPEQKAVLVERLAKARAARKAKG
jgi:hypothetical protein